MLFSERNEPPSDKLGGEIFISSRTLVCLSLLLRVSERSERSEHTVVLSLRFLYIYIYSVTKILRKIRATTFTEKLRKITREGDERWVG